MIADAHIDTISELLDRGLKFGDENRSTHADLPRLLRAGVLLQICALFTMPNVNKSVQLVEILEQAAYAKRQLKENEDRAQLVLTRGDVQNLSAGKLAVMLSVEGGGALSGSLSILEILFELGIRGLTLTWNDRNELADGVGDFESGGGLSRFGREVVRRMDEIGMVVDVSHLSERGFWDVMEIAQGPVIASHSNAKSLCGHVRNLTDDQIRALAERGGFIGLNFLPAFLSDSGKATIPDLVRHAKHIADVGGVEVLGLGTDFDGIGQVPEGIQDVTSLPKVLTAIGREFSKDEIEKIAGLNLQRVLGAILPA